MRMWDGKFLHVVMRRKIIELEEELKIVGNNMKSLEIAEQEVRTSIVPVSANSLISQIREFIRR